MSDVMHSPIGSHGPRTNLIALKEWAVVCRALAKGIQTVLLRKGGIHEPGGTFRCEHDSFWLYPTRFHQGAESLSPVGVALLKEITPPTDSTRVPISLWAEVKTVRHLTSPAEVAPYLDRQILHPDAVYQRFHYKRPELFAIELICQTLDSPFHVLETPAIAGCHSWVNLSDTAG